VSVRTIAPLRVGWLGPRPAWATDGAAAAGIEFVDPAEAEVVHVVPGASANGIASGVPVVVEADGAGEQDVRGAAAVVASSPAVAARVAAREPGAAARTVVVRPPLDLETFAPERSLLSTEGPRLKRFKRFHRLGTPAFLYVGPYTRTGGLDVAIEAAFRLRETYADVRLIAIPDGPVDAKFLDECEMRALGLGHRGIVEWQVEEAELPFWFATATVVTVPVRQLAAVPSALTRAAAAARAFVGSDLEPLKSEAKGLDWARLVPAGDAGALADACAELFADEQQGAAARAWAEQELSPEAVLRRLAELWHGVAPNADSRQVA
jgi:glycosyltransferase involved in cell wall biosynthesis